MADAEPILFVSHVSEDRVAALEIVEELERRGIPCWIAPRNIHPGRPFDDEIVAAIEGSRAILLIFSDLCNESEYIRREVTVAGESQKLIIPLRIEDAQPRRGLRVRLSDLHWLDGFVARERAIDELVRRFGPRAEPSPPHHREPEPHRPETSPAQPQQPDFAPPPAPAAAAQAARNYRAAAAGVAALTAAGVGAAVWFFSAGTGPSPATVPAAPLTGTVATADAVARGKAAFERKDYSEAMRWDRPAAEAGNAVAQTYVGYLYEKGLGVPQDQAEALAWYRKAADQGHAPAQRNLGSFYERGGSVARDYAQALLWYRLAAEQGNSGAQTNLGYLYEKGIGVVQDYVEALRWYRLAAEQGEATAQNNIGAFYDKGYGVAQDYAEALRWYHMAATQGNIDAVYNLALLYADGRGVPRDLAQARQWMEKAAVAGDPEARKWLDEHRG